MGICCSSATLGNQMTHGSSVYALEDDGSCPERGMRRLACLYSQQGSKGINQDAAILCKACDFWTLLVLGDSVSLSYSDQNFVKSNYGYLLSKFY